MTLPISSLNALHGAAAAKPAEPVDPKALKAAKDFESIFLRTLLSSLEKTTSISGGGKLNTGQSTYGSMVVGALADKVSASIRDSRDTHIVLAFQEGHASVRFWTTPLNSIWRRRGRSSWCSLLRMYATPPLPD